MGSSREFILSPSVSLSDTIQWRIHAGFVEGGGPLDPPLLYCLGWIGTVGKLALPIPPQSLRPRCAPDCDIYCCFFESTKMAVCDWLILVKHGNLIAD